jgi:O-Antigen ligase
MIRYDGSNFTSSMQQVGTPSTQLNSDKVRDAHGPLDRWVLATIFIVFVWPTYFVFGFPGVLNVSLPRLLLLIWVIVYFVLPFFSFRCRLALANDRSNGRTFFFLFAVWTVWQFTCDIVGEEPWNSAILTTLEILNVNAVAILPLFIAGRPSGRIGIALTIFAAVFVVSSIALIEWAFQVNVGSFFAPMSNISDEFALQAAEDNYRDGAYRVKSLFAHPIILAQNAAALAPLLFVFATRWNGAIIRTCALGLLLCTPVIIYSTQARSGVIVLFVAAVCYYWFSILTVPGDSLERTKRLIPAVIVSTSVLILSYGVFEQLIEGRTSTEAQSSLGREEMVSRGLDATTRSPIFGYGKGLSVFKAGLVGPRNARTIDNFYLSAMIDFGFVGIALLLAIYLSVILAGLRAANCATNEFDRGFIVAMTSATAGLLPGLYVISSWDSTIIIYLTAGIVASVSRPRAAGHQIRSMDLSRFPPRR